MRGHSSCDKGAAPITFKRVMLCFPIEIFYLLFDHLWADEILFSFWNISEQLDSALLSYPNYAINFESIRKSSFDAVCRHIRPDQVTSMILSNKIDTPNQWSLFRSLFSLTQFRHLRALKLIEIDVDERRLDLSKLDHLLSLELIGNTNSFVIESPPSLQRLLIKSSPGVLFDLEPMMIAAIPLRQLHHLTLPCCSYAQFQEICRESPQLVSLKILLIALNANEINTFAHLHPRLSTLSLSIVVSGKSKNRLVRGWTNSCVLIEPCRVFIWNGFFDRFGRCAS